MDNQLPADTSVHWHGIRLRNDADGVPGVTQDPIRPGTAYRYEFTAPDPGTYFFHPHVGVQLDRGLYAPLVIDDPAEPGDYDAEWILVLDDWVDGTGRTPDDVLARLVADGGPSHGGGMGGMDHGAMMGGMAAWARPPLAATPATSPTRTSWSTANPRRPRTSSPPSPGSGCGCGSSTPPPTPSSGSPSAGTGCTVTHTDGYAVQPVRTPTPSTSGWASATTSTVTLADGVFPLVAVPFGKQGTARAVVRTGCGHRSGTQTRRPARAGRRRCSSAPTCTPAEASRLPAAHRTRPRA